MATPINVKIADACLKMAHKLIDTYGPDKSPEIGSFAMGNDFAWFYDKTGWMVGWVNLETGVAYTVDLPVDED